MMGIVAKVEDGYAIVTEAHGNQYMVDTADGLDIEAMQAVQFEPVSNEIREAIISKVL